jgi:adenosine kinase
MSGWTSLGLDQSHIRAVPKTFTAQAFITTDLDDNQITAFHPGAMNHSHENQVTDAAGVTLGIVAPDGREGMIQHARVPRGGHSLHLRSGPGLPMFSGVELAAVRRTRGLRGGQRLRGASCLQERTGHKLERLAKDVKALIVTLGAQGSRIYAEA